MLAANSGSDMLLCLNSCNNVSRSASIVAQLVLGRKASVICLVAVALGKSGVSQSKQS